MKSDNAKQHFRHHETHPYAKLEGDARKNGVENLKRNLRQQTSLMNTFIKTNSVRNEVSYKIAHRLGVAGKPYSDGEIVKGCILDAVRCLHPGKEGEYAAIPLSRVTIQRRQDDIAQQLHRSVWKKISAEGTLFAIAVDESTDITDSAQLLIFICSLSSSFELCEDLLAIETLSFRTCGDDILLAVKKACNRAGANLRNLRGICTDGAPAMLGKQNGFVSKFSDYVAMEYGNKQLINLHCIIHQEALCTKAVVLDNVLRDVKKVIMFIRSKALNHRQFRAILKDSEALAEDILFHTDVLWLSQGETTRRVLQLQKEIVEFYLSKEKLCPLSDRNFLTSLAFLVDLLMYVNTLHESLQGLSTTVCLVYRKVQEFCDKCRLLKNHLLQLNYCHFPQLTSLIDSGEIQRDTIPTTAFIAVLDSLLEEFAERFQDFKKIASALQLVASPHLVELKIHLLSCGWN